MPAQTTCDGSLEKGRLGGIAVVYFALRLYLHLNPTTVT